jgi:hypothetical protein
MTSVMKTARERDRSRAGLVDLRQPVNSGWAFTGVAGPASPLGGVVGLVDWLVVAVGFGWGFVGCSDGEAGGLGAHAAGGPPHRAPARPAFRPGRSGTP